MEDRRLLISDVDGTLLGDDVALEAFAAWCDRQRDWLRLVYNSGRFVESVLDSVATSGLPAPDAVIGGVGTQIHCLRTGTRLSEWPATGDGWQPERIRALLRKYDALELQPAELLSEHKISYFAHSASESMLHEACSRLAEAGCDVEIIYSSSRDLDVLPRGVNKGTAAAHLASRWGYAPEQVYVSGDTANDLAMFAQGFCGIVVGNAHDELRQLAGPDVFLATKSHAAGVQQGVEHWRARQAATSLGGTCPIDGVAVRRRL
ncbi:MAG: HAD-IIB family hydrolase [Planctomycetales bacterium]|nr:HAD-IIB family hydrolase [Planctomycetales bacterium]